jgi:acetyl-CoA/propionyl-CoA carboxylase carboxyl transferase subunit
MNYLSPALIVEWLLQRESIKGNKVIIFASDATKQGGALGADGAHVIVEAYKAAMKEQLPIIGIWHSGGARLSDGVSSLSAFGEVFSAMVAASGRIPQLSLILGPAAGGGAYGPALTDIVVLSTLKVASLLQVPELLNQLLVKK